MRHLERESGRREWEETGEKLRDRFRDETMMRDWEETEGESVRQIQR